MALLDLSAAFDTVEHDILHNFIETSLGISGSALQWFQSYLTERTQKVIVQNTQSDSKNLLYGVPQGSIMGPLIFCVYTLPLGRIIRSHSVKYHIYADDTQLLCPFQKEDPYSALKKLESCVADIRVWMLRNQLKINDDKTQFLVLTKKSQKHMSSNFVLQVGSCSVAPSATARNLGVMFDSNMSMDAQISSICKSVHFHLRKIGSIRHLLSSEATSMLVHSLISSRLDYCNVLLQGVPSCKLQRLQSVQNCAARIVSKCGKYDHITPILCSLHWLPVKERIMYKLILMAYKALHGLAPLHIQNLVSVPQVSRSLRSANRLLLSVPSSNLKSYGDRSFTVAAANEWNKLPVTLKASTSVDIFKSGLKTYLFKSAYKL